MKILQKRTLSILSLGILACLFLTVAALGNCDCGAKNIASECKASCAAICENGTLVSKDVEEQPSCKLVTKIEYEPVDATVATYEPFEQTNATKHCVLTNTTTQKSVTLVGINKTLDDSEECGVKTIGGDCEPLIAGSPTEEVAVNESTQFGQAVTDKRMKCYTEVSRRVIQKVVDRQGHSLLEVEKTYRVCENTTITVENRAAAPVITEKPLGNPCPNNCKQGDTGCIPCAA